MRVVLSSFQESSACAWCEREKETVTADFGDGFIRQSALCWRCLQKAVRVHQRQTQAASTAESGANSTRRAAERTEPPRA